MECKVKTPEGKKRSLKSVALVVRQEQEVHSKIQNTYLIKQKKPAEVELRASADVHDSKKLVWSAGDMEK